METIIFFIIVGYLFHFITTQQDEDYEARSSIWFYNLFHKDKINLNPDNKSTKNDFISKLNNTIISDENEYLILQNQKLEYFKSEDWKSLRKKILFRDNYKCSLCPNSIPLSQLNIHHITYKNLFNENTEDLKTLCDTCHTNLHDTIGYPTKDINIYNTEYFWSKDFDKIAKAEADMILKDSTLINKLY